ncbi:MAG TPA: hypothetical protein VGI10_04440 [Polyangiaceae bacterium]|jgi:hypothetical protein
MPVRYSEQMPVAAIRDLLGIVRVMYATEVAGDGHPVRLQELVEIGKLLAGAYADARTLPADCLGHRSGWRKAEEAVQRLSLLIADAMPLRPVALKAGERVTEGGKPPADALTAADREARRLHRARRN